MFPSDIFNELNHLMQHEWSDPFDLHQRSHYPRVLSSRRPTAHIHDRPVHQLWDLAQRQQKEIQRLRQQISPSENNTQSLENDSQTTNQSDSLLPSGWMGDSIAPFFSSFGGPSSGSSLLSTWHPTCEMVERDGDMVVRAELPGVDPADVKVELVNDNKAVRISGTRSHVRSSSQNTTGDQVDSESGNNNLIWSERSFGSFTRTFPLPPNLPPTAIQAALNDGVLEVSFPKPAIQDKKKDSGVGGEQGVYRVPILGKTKRARVVEEGDVVIEDSPPHNITN